MAHLTLDYIHYGIITPLQENFSQETKFISWILNVWNEKQRIALFFSNALGKFNCLYLTF